MNENRRQILELLAAGKINADEAERLLSALEDRSPTASATRTDGPAVTVKTKVKYLRVLVEAHEKEGPTTVNVRVPMQLLRAGVRLASLIPVQAHEQLDRGFEQPRRSADAVADQAGES